MTIQWLYGYTFSALICLAGSASAWRSTWVRQRQRRLHHGFSFCAVQFGSASDLTRLYPQDATRETSAGSTSRSECQKALQVRCRLQARISTALPSTQTIDDYRRINCAECLGVCWYGCNRNINIVASKLFPVWTTCFWVVLFLYLFVPCSWNIGIVTCQISGEAMQLDSACPALGCVPTRCEMEKKDSETARFGVAECF